MAADVGRRAVPTAAGGRGAPARAPLDAGAALGGGRACQRGARRRPATYKQPQHTPPARAPSNGPAGVGRRRPRQRGPTKMGATQRRTGSSEPVWAAAAEVGGGGAARRALDRHKNWRGQAGDDDRRGTTAAWRGGRGHTHTALFKRLWEPGRDRRQERRRRSSAAGSARCRHPLSPPPTRAARGCRQGTRPPRCGSRPGRRHRCTRAPRPSRANDEATSVGAGAGVRYIVPVCCPPVGQCEARAPRRRPGGPVSRTVAAPSLSFLFFFPQIGRRGSGLHSGGAPVTPTGRADTSGRLQPMGGRCRA